jgi:hypothetical protein
MVERVRKGLVIGSLSRNQEKKCAPRAKQEVGILLSGERLYEKDYTLIGLICR